MLTRKLAFATAATVAGWTGSVALERRPGLLDSTPLDFASSAVIATVRFTRALRTAAVVMADYRFLFARHSEYTSDEYRAERSDVHRRCSDRCLNLARKQGAVYVKIGQHVASMNHAVPPEYTSKLKLLEDRAAYRPYSQIKRALDRELERPMSDVFDHFNHKPVAAASLAQVHEATLKDTGERVAVKVQYPGLEALVRGDLASIKFLSWMLSWVFPYFKMDWVVEQFRRNLEKELDFELEAQSALRTQKFFKDDPRVFVPDVYNDTSTKKVLTMEYIDGFRVDDLDALHDYLVDPHAVAQTVVDAFAQMIYVNGFVHCDPHAGNLMVRPGPGGAFELYLLDHGLYRQLDDDFRQSYCKLWKGLVLRRTKDVDEACEELGAPGFANVFSVFLLNRSWSIAKRLGTDLRVKMGRDELRRLRSDLRDGGLRSQADVNEFVERIPDDLLLVFKMTSLVRNVNKALGATVNRFKVNARYAVRGLRHVNNFSAESSGGADDTKSVIVAGTHSERLHPFSALAAVTDWFGLLIDRVCIELQFLVLDVALLAVKWWFGSSVPSVRSDQKANLDASESAGLIG